MANNMCVRRADDALPEFCEIMGCDELASYDCYPATAPGVTLLTMTIALCDGHAHEADPALSEVTP